jgi:hypothetical protein
MFASHFLIFLQLVTGTNGEKPERRKAGMTEKPKRLKSRNDRVSRNDQAACGLPEIYTFIAIVSITVLYIGV